MRWAILASLCLLNGFFASRLLAAPASDWVKVGPQGQLIYKSDERGDQIPDFSQCGYRGGDVPVPLLPVKVTVAPAPGDAGARIQAALDQVGRLPLDTYGMRGAVLLKKGRYDIAGSIRLTQQGVVLRGEGPGEDGTVLIATGKKQRSLIVVGDGRAQPPAEDAEDRPTGELAQTKRNVTAEYVPVGAKSLPVDDVTGLKIGDEITVRRPSTGAWIHEIGMDRIPPAKDGGTVQWKPGTKDLLFSRIITGISGPTLSLDAPLTNSLDKAYGGGLVLPGPTSPTTKYVGVENLRGVSEYRGVEDEDHGWVLVALAAAEHAWVRRVTSVHFGYSCVNVSRGSRHVTIEDCSCLDPISRITGSRRYSFALAGQLTLVQRCYARHGRHDFVMHALAAGPNAFVDCLAEKSHADSGPHHRWSAGVLYDNVTVRGATDGGEINIRNRGNSGTGHGWAGANQVLWNCRAASIICQSPPTAHNWAIGCICDKHSGNGHWESVGKPVEPRSLYQAQLAARLQAAAVKTRPVKP